MCFRSCGCFYYQKNTGSKVRKFPSVVILWREEVGDIFFTLFIVSWLFLAIYPELPYFGDVVLTVSVITLPI